MPTCIFILSRFTLRVDHVLFRTFDTRIYHSFQSSPPLIIRETRGWEAPYDNVHKVHISIAYLCLHHSYHFLLQLLPKRDDLTPLTDPTWIAKVLSEMPQQNGNTGWRGLGANVEIIELKS